MAGFSTTFEFGEILPPGTDRWTVVDILEQQLRKHDLWRALQPPRLTIYSVDGDTISSLSLEEARQVEQERGASNVRMISGLWWSPNRHLQLSLSPYVQQVVIDAESQLELDGMKAQLVRALKLGVVHPATPAPATPARATPARATPAPATPAPATPAPATPAPATPAPATPAPATRTWRRRFWEWSNHQVVGGLIVAGVVALLAVLWATLH